MYKSILDAVEEKIKVLEKRKHGDYLSRAEECKPGSL